MKSRQFCSVCRQWLDMEVVPTGDGDDDGVVWFRCPQCQGFLPKLSGLATEPGNAADASEVGVADADGGGDADDAFDAGEAVDDSDIEAALLGAGIGDGFGDDESDAGDGDDAGVEAGADAEDEPADETVGEAPPADGPGATPSNAEPVLEYAAMLAAVDPATAVPYRPWDSYEVGQCVLHLAWNDCGVVVAKEALPGGRRVIKCWFQGVGVVRLIENAPR